MSTIDLTAHIERLRLKESLKPTLKEASLIFWGEQEDKKYLARLKPCVAGYTTLINLNPVTTLSQVQLFCEARRCDKIITSSLSLLTCLLKWSTRKAPSLNNYAGSYFTIPSNKFCTDIEIVIIPPIKQLMTITYMPMLMTRMISKLTKPDSWFPATKFSWELLTPANFDSVFKEFQSAFLISVDIETFKQDATIRCVGFTAFFECSLEEKEAYDDFILSQKPSQEGGKTASSGVSSTDIFSRILMQREEEKNAPNRLKMGNPKTKFISKSVVLPLDSDYSLIMLRNMNWQLKAPKVLQNGKYDCAYLARYNAPMYNYLYDTANMFHCMYSEMPKDLGFLGAFFVRDAMYWKDMSSTSDLFEYYKYNALDTWVTGNALLAMILELPEYAKTNYLLEFPLTFPCHMAEMRGIKRDMNKLKEAREKADKDITTKSKTLNNILGLKSPDSFNVKSPIQMKQLLKLLGCKDLPSADAASLAKAKFRHPFNARLINLVLEIRAARTLKEKYLQVGDAAKEFIGLGSTDDTILYALNPHGTDSSRLASREHHFWCGLQVQNIPRGTIVKGTLRANEGFYLAEVDLEQAESRDTAYISGDLRLIDAVENSPDFHSANASAFFGIPFNKIYDTKLGKVLDKSLRDLAKRVNHGANYNMGAYILVETMGEENVIRAQQLLHLPKGWSYIQVAEHLLQQFHKTYPNIKNVFYKGVVTEVITSNKLTHHIVRGKAWTRYCFGNPETSKHHLNSYVSHPPQALNAQTLNKAWLAVFKELSMNAETRDNIRVLAQIHDSILFEYRIGHEYICDKVKELMEIPVTIKGYDNEVRTFTVPAGIKSGIDGKPATYWSETE